MRIKGTPLEELSHQQLCDYLVRLSKALRALEADKQLLTQINEELWDKNAQLKDDLYDRIAQVKQVQHEELLDQVEYYKAMVQRILDLHSKLVNMLEEDNNTLLKAFETIKREALVDRRNRLYNQIEEEVSENRGFRVRTHKLTPRQLAKADEVINLRTNVEVLREINQDLLQANKELKEELRKQKEENKQQS